MPNAITRSRGQVVDYTPSSAVSPGDIIDLGDMLAVSPLAIAASALGSVQLAGEFDLVKDDDSGPVFALGEPVFWDVVNSTAIKTNAWASGCVFFGCCTKAAATGDATVRARLDPRALPAWLQGRVWEDVDISGGSKTLDAEDVGKVMNVTVGDAANVVTLPATVIGYIYVVRCGTTGQRVAISPNLNDKLAGANSAGVDNKDMILAAATSRAGDYIVLVADGSVGYYIAASRGVWAAEA